MNIYIDGKQYKINLTSEVAKSIKKNTVTLNDILTTLQDYTELNDMPVSSGGFIYEGEGVILSGEKTADDEIEIEFAKRVSPVTTITLK